MTNFFDDLIVISIIGFSICAIGFGLSLAWFRAVGREIDAETVSLSAKIFGGIFVGGILMFLAIKLL